MIPDSVLEEAFLDVLGEESRVQKARMDAYWQGRRDEKELQKTLVNNKPSSWTVKYVNIT